MESENGSSGAVSFAISTSSNDRRVDSTHKVPQLRSGWQFVVVSPQWFVDQRVGKDVPSALRSLIDQAMDRAILLSRLLLFSRQIPRVIL
jgi:hypothetical protein